MSVSGVDSFTLKSPASNWINEQASDDQRRRFWKCAGQRWNSNLMIDESPIHSDGLWCHFILQQELSPPICTTLIAQQYFDAILLIVVLLLISHHPELTFRQFNRLSGVRRLFLQTVFVLFQNYFVQQDRRVSTLLILSRH